MSLREGVGRHDALLFDHQLHRCDTRLHRETIGNPATA